jgi:hypothetical protein
MILPLSSCRKLVEVAPPINQLESGVVFRSDASAQAALTGIYSQMMTTPSQALNSSTTLYAGMAADELHFYSSDLKEEFLTNQITLANHGLLLSSFWQPLYTYIYAANACLEGLENSKGLTPSVKTTLQGEARFIRAFSYFYLVNLFGEVPLITSTDYKINASLPRSAVSDVYTQIHTDLIAAEDLLPVTYPTQGRVRPIKWAAASLLARVYLFEGNWAGAETEASAVINSGQYQLVSDLNKVFLSTSPEAIFQLMPANPNNNTWEGNAMLPASVSSTPTFLLTTTLLNAFEASDQRKAKWITSRTYASQTYYYPYKYKVYGNGAPLSEYYMVLRLAEQYLIRAEAKARQGKITEAKADLDVIRLRAGLSGTLAGDKNTLLSAIEQERRVELFSEWGHRWLDLKRTGRVDAVLGPLKSTWQPTAQLWPIPQTELNVNPALTQNPGY